MARVSQIVRSPCNSTGTRREGDTAAIAASRFSSDNGISRSVNGIPAWRSANQALSDQDE